MRLKDFDSVDIVANLYNDVSYYDLVPVVCVLPNLTIQYISCSVFWQTLVLPLQIFDITFVRQKVLLCLCPPLTLFWPVVLPGQVTVTFLVIFLSSQFYVDLSLLGWISPLIGSHIPT